MEQTLDKKLLKVSDLVQLDNLTIPAYQRPYKWTPRHVQQLFQDIETHKNRGTYRLGTIVFHQDKQEAHHPLNIVDGQQRTLTLILIVHAIIQEHDNKIKRQDLSDQLKELTRPLNHFIERQTFESRISQYNLHKNYLEISRLISQSAFTEQYIDFLLNKCEVVTFTLADISEAFQFFDSQNARGRDLEPHDLLKAYHLREFSETEKHLKADSVSGWEALESHELATLFASYLYRIRRWSSGHSARYFGKNEAALFKGVNIDNVDHYPYVETLRITHHYVDDYNQQYQRKIDGQNKKFPFHLDQMIINGRRFFEMAYHYHCMVTGILDAEHGKTNDFRGQELTAQSASILKELNTYPARHRTGDKYVRAIFDCALIFYIDKFADIEISGAIEKLFIWAFTLRIKQQVVQLASIDNHVLNNNVFRRIKDATSPSDVLSIPLETLNDKTNANNRRKEDYGQDPLVKLFKGMKYYE